MSLKKWLTNNKVFFETIAAILISIMALIVSYQLNLISKKQMEIIEKENVPLMHLYIDMFYNQSKNMFTEDRLKIFNEGEPLSHFDCDNAIFIRVEIVTKENEIKRKEVKIPLNSYYIGTFRTNNSKGLIATLANEGNNEKAYSLLQSFSQFCSSKHISCFAEIIRYVQLTYTDKFGKKYKEVYLVDPVIGGIKLDEKEGERIIDEHNEGYKERLFLDFDDISAEKIYKMCFDKINQRKYKK